MSAGEDVVLEGNASIEGVYVTVTIRVEPRAQYPDVTEFGEEAGATAARIARRVGDARPSVPF